MIKLRKIDKSTRHFTGRLVFGIKGSITFPSSEKVFMIKLEEKIMKEVKGFKYGEVVLEFFSIKIK
jgi:hypothetical protein